MEVKMVCIYHSRDLDGWMSAAIVQYKYRDVQLIGWDYGQPIPDLSADEIIMVDISFPKETMKEIADKVTWIDHHISAIKDIASIEPLPFTAFKRIQGIRDINFAACELTWKYFFPEHHMPECVRLLGRYDCFGHKGTDEERTVLEFQYGARSFIDGVLNAHAVMTTEIAFFDGVIKHNPTEEILSCGKGIYHYLCTEAKQIYARKFDITLNGHKFACVNQDRFNPINFGINYHDDDYDGFACFWYVNGQFTYSLYNDNGLVDCSELAKQRGGGGHKGASGFRSDKIIL